MKIKSREETKEWNVIECPLCESDMILTQISHDGIKALLCKKCKSELHLGSWEIQAEVEKVYKRD